MKRLRNLSVITTSLALSLLLGACSTSVTGVARVGDEVITTQVYEQQLAFFESVERVKNPPAEGKDIPDLTALTIDTLVFEQLAQNEMKGRQDEITRVFTERRQQIVDRLGGQDAYAAQLRGYQLTQEAFEASLRRQVVSDLHYERYASDHQPSEETLQEYIKKKGDEAKLIDFTEVVVPTNTESDNLLKQFTAELPPFESLSAKYNFDNFDTTWAAQHTAVGKGDESIFRTDILTQAVGTTRVHRYNSLFHVITVTKRYDDFATMKDHVKDLFLKENYLAYMNELARDQHVRVFEDKIPKKSAEN